MHMDINWAEPWGPLAPAAGDLRAELHRELSPSHPLFGVTVAAIGRRSDCDDVLFQLLDGSNRVAVVHLTWRGRPEEDSRWPDTVVYGSLQDWVDRGMKADNQEFTANDLTFARATAYVLDKNAELFRRLA
jgi:hypothetical protein